MESFTATVCVAIYITVRKRLACMPFHGEVSVKGVLSGKGELMKKYLFISNIQKYIKLRERVKPIYSRT